jgi:hypothetical protein
MKDSRCKCSHDSFNPACPLHGEYWVDGVRVIQQHHLPGGGVIIPKDHPAYAHYFPQKSRAADDEARS